MAEFNTHYDSQLFSYGNSQGRFLDRTNSWETNFDEKKSQLVQYYLIKKTGRGAQKQRSDIHAPYPARSRSNVAQSLARRFYTTGQRRTYVHWHQRKIPDLWLVLCIPRDISDNTFGLTCYFKLLRKHVHFTKLYVENFEAPRKKRDKIWGVTISHVLP